MLTTIYQPHQCLAGTSAGHPGPETDPIQHCCEKASQAVAGQPFGDFLHDANGDSLDQQAKQPTQATTSHSLISCLQQCVRAECNKVSGSRQILAARSLLSSQQFLK
jgi:hypothetical protein